MFENSVERAAAKASLATMKCDLDALCTSFSHDSKAASKALFSLLEKSTFALSINAADDELKQVVASSSYPFQSPRSHFADEKQK